VIVLKIIYCFAKFSSATRSSRSKILLSWSSRRPQSMSRSP